MSILFVTEYVDMFPQTNRDILLHFILVWIGSRKLTSIRTYRSIVRLCAFWADKNQSILNNISDFAGEKELMNKEKADMIIT